MKGCTKCFNTGGSLPTSQPFLRALPLHFRVPVTSGRFRQSATAIKDQNFLDGFLK